MDMTAWATSLALFNPDKPVVDDSHLAQPVNVVIKVDNTKVIGVKSKRAGLLGQLGHIAGTQSPDHPGQVF